jgi:type IV secretory pathway VirD2 relaxase
MGVARHAPGSGTVPYAAARLRPPWRNRVLRTRWHADLRWSCHLSRRHSEDADRFRVRPGAPKDRGQPFINRVLKQAGKAGSVRKSGGRPGSRLGRGHVAARFAAQSLVRGARRVTIKTRLVHLAKAGSRSTITHLRYIEREGVGRDGEAGRAYGPTTDDADLNDFEQRGRKDRHQFRFIVSPEDAAELEDLRRYTRDLMVRMEADLGTRLDWVAVDHWNTDNPHTHVVLRGKDDTGKDLIIARDYIAEGMRHRASGLATEWLGPRTELEIQRAMQREVDQERWTGLDRTLQRETVDGSVHVKRFAEPRLQHQRQVLIGRLQRLQQMGLATETQPGVWAAHSEAETTLRAMGERGDIIRTMQRAMGGTQRELAVFEPDKNARSIIGRVTAKGLADELYDRGYLVIDGIDGKAHYVALPPWSELEQYPTGAVVEVKSSANVRAADRNIAALGVDGVYRADHHLAVAQSHATPDRDPREVVAAHVRRLEALRRAGIVEREAEGVWRIPGDLAARGRRYDAQRFGGGMAVELKSHLPIERQARVIGATWLDQQLIGGGKGLGDLGFGAEVKDALRQRANFLVEQGLAEHRGQRVVLARNLLATLRGRELAQTAKDFATESGLEHRSVADGQRVAGIYRRSIMLVSGRYAMLDDGMGFSLVPWKPVIEQRLGQQLAATVRGGSVSWEIGQQRGPALG